MTVSLILLAAGKGTRMCSQRPKVLHEVADAPLVVHALQAAAPLAPVRTVVVAGHGADQVRRRVQAHDPAIQIVLQDQQLGTAHAVLQARTALQDMPGDAVILYGDTPFVRPQTLQRMLQARQARGGQKDGQDGGADIVVLSFRAAAPGRYGRLVTAGERLLRIVEVKDATPDELAIDLCNSGVICADRGLLFDLIAQVGNDNAAGEFYLTDIVGLANAAGLRCAVVVCDEAETLGINSRLDLAAAEAVFQDRARRAALEAGVTLVVPETVVFSFDTVLDVDVVVEPNVVFGPGVRVETGARIRAFSHLEGCHVGPDAVVGPYARLRPGTALEAGVKIGNFVETKAARVGLGAKINHLSYVGDADVGAGANIGAGTITCNYDGAGKNRTEIGAGAFIGSNTSLVAPVAIGAGALVGAGSVISEDVPQDALALARAKQTIRPGGGARHRERAPAGRRGRAAN